MSPWSHTAFNTLDLVKSLPQTVREVLVFKINVWLPWVFTAVCRLSLAAVCRLLAAKHGLSGA